MLLKITVLDKSLEDEELHKVTMMLLREVKQVEGVESVSLLETDTLPVGAKSVGSFLLGVLSADVNFESIENLVRFLGRRFWGESVEIKIEANGKKLKVKANSQEELIAIVESASKFISDLEAPHD